MRKIIAVVAFILVISVCLVAMINGYPSLQRYSAVSYVPSAAGGPVIQIEGSSWTRVVDWRFSEGLFPGGWSWGEWRLTNGLLRGSDYTGGSSVYFFPFTHGGDAMIETKVKLLQPLGDTDVKIYLLTRDSDMLNYESGMVLHGAGRELSVRHMAKQIEYIAENVPTYSTIEYNKWYIMRFMIRDNLIKAFLNGTLVYASDWRFYTGSNYTAADQTSEFIPVGNYREPHISVLDGTADFEYVRIYIAN